jgi:hypothetical protein
MASQRLEQLISRVSLLASSDGKIVGIDTASVPPG